MNDPATTRFILIGTSHAGNVGACARAMKVMGFADLVLVAPRDARVLGREETRQRASGANDVLERARIVATLDEALDGLTHLAATAMTPRDFGPPVFAPRTWFEMLLKEELPVDGFKGIEAESSEKCWPPIALGLLFGSERFGMSNADVYRCHAALSIPTNPAFGSLNLAAAVQVIAYEWRQALAARGAGFAVRDPRAAERLADAAQVAGLLAHWESALVEIGFLDPASPKKLLPRLNQLFNRAALRDEEVHILRGVARAMLKKSVAERATPSAPTRDAGNG